MNIATWILAGGIIGWIGFSLLKFNLKRGMIVSILIGMAGGYLGGSLLAPMLSAALTTHGDFSPLSLFTAFACAAGFVIVSDMFYKRFGM
ncbi:MAG TPA: hypothetical protein VFO57_05435 [Burkholderiales bacterium]|nr:hypothetical protein [Burkholderiales bacterium]